MNNPGSSTAKIQDLIPRVKAILQNRSDVNEANPNPFMRPSSWIQDALREITESEPFEELRQPNPPIVTIGPGLGFQGSNYKYLVSQFVSPGDDLTLTEDPVIFLDPPTNSISYPMDYETPKAIATLLNISGGIPFKYCRYGTQFWFGTNPGQNYQVYLPYQIRHTFNDANVPLSQVCVPPSWFEIIAYAAAERGAINLRWNDQADMIHKTLYGDPASALPGGKLARPGLIAGRKFQQENDRRISVVQMTPFSQRY